MSITRKARREAESLKNLKKKNCYKAYAASALILTLGAGAAAPATAAVAAGQFMTAQPSSSVDQGYINAPTLAGISLETTSTGNFGFVADMYRQADSSPVFNSEIRAKQFKPEAAAEKQAWDEAKENLDAQQIHLDVAGAEQSLWTGGFETTYNADHTLYKVTFVKDKSTREYNSWEAVEIAQEAADDAWNLELTEYTRLQDLTRAAQAKYEAATAVQDDLANFTYVLTLTESDYKTKSFETKDGVLKAGDNFSFHHNGVEGTATVASNTPEGVLTLDVALKQTLEKQPATRITYKDVSPAATPGKAVNDTYNFVWEDVLQVMKVRDNDILTEGASWAPNGFAIIDPATGQRIQSLKTQFGTFETAEHGNLTFRGNRDATFADYKLEYENIDTAAVTYRGTVTISQEGQTAWVATTPTDVSKIDMSDSSKYHEVIRNKNVFLDKKAVAEGRYNADNALFSATKPEAMDEVAILTVGDKVAIDVFAKANAGITYANTLHDQSGYTIFDPKAQERLIEDASLQAVNDVTGEAIGIGESTVIKGVGKISVIPATGTSDIVPVTYDTHQRTTAKAASNTFDRPYVTFTPVKGYLGEVPSFSARWKTVAYGEKTADLKGFWNSYDVDGAGSELVGTSKIHLRYDAINLTNLKTGFEHRSTGRAGSLNPGYVAPSPTFDPANYTRLGSFSGGSARSIQLAHGANDAVKVATGTAVSADVTANDTVAGPIANHGFSQYKGRIGSEKKEYGFKSADGSLVKELTVDGGTWITESDDWNVYARFIANEGVITAPSVVWVNKNESDAEIVLTSPVTEPEYEFAPSTLRLVDTNGNLVGSLTVSEVGTWKVNPENAHILFTPVATYKGTADVKYSIVDRWVGSAAAKTHAQYEYAVKPYGSEAAGTLSVTVGNELPEEVPTPEKTPEETPEETPVPEKEETPVPEKEEIPVPLQEEVPTPDNSITTTENVPTNDMETADSAPEENMAGTGVSVNGLSGGIAALMIALGAFLTGRRNKALPKD